MASLGPQQMGLQPPSFFRIATHRLPCPEDGERKAQGGGEELAELRRENMELRSGYRRVVTMHAGRSGYPAILRIMISLQLITSYNTCNDVLFQHYTQKLNTSRTWLERMAAPPLAATHAAAVPIVGHAHLLHEATPTAAVPMKDLLQSMSSRVRVLEEERDRERGERERLSLRVVGLQQSLLEAREAHGAEAEKLKEEHQKSLSQVITINSTQILRSKLQHTYVGCRTYGVLGVNINSLTS